MIKNTHAVTGRIIASILGLCFCTVLFSGGSCFAQVKAQGLTDVQLDRFSANNIIFYNPGECMSKTSALNSDSCFKIDSSTSASEFFYPEGCLNTGDCVSDAVKYYAQGDEPGSDGGLNATKNNTWIYGDTKSDPDFGGAQYIFAENYDWEYDGSETKGTKNGGSSDRKYYWVVLPASAYTNGLGDTYVAAFENISDPVYLITFDAHSCDEMRAWEADNGRGVSYCDKAEADPDEVAIGKASIAFFTASGGFDSSVTGKLTSLCRLNGTGEVLASQNSANKTDPSTSSDSSSKKDSDTEESGAFTVSASTNKDNEGDSNSSGSSNNSTSVVGNVHEASDSIPCANGTKDLGVTEDAYYDGNKITIRLCSIPNISSTSSTDTDGNIHVNSRASGAYYALGKKYNELYGGNLSASQSFRTMEQQQYFWDCYQTGSCNDGNLAAQPGHSNHQLGTAVDFNMGGSGWGDTGVSGFFNEYLDDYGLARNVTSEDWHVSHASDTNPDDMGSDSGCTSYEGDFPQYYQGNYEASDHENSTLDWTTMLYGRSPSSPEYNYKTVAETGCGLVSMAMLATALTGKDIYPQDIADITKDVGYYNLIDKPYSKLDTLVGAEYGLEVIEESYSSKDDAYTKIKDYLNKGYMIHLSGEGAHTGFSRSDTDGHYVGIFKIDSQDNVWVANSNSVGNSTVPLQNIIDAIHAGEFGAIRKSGSGSGSSCFDYCDNSGSNGSESVGEEGLTIEQAKTFMMNYGENKNDSSKNAVGSAQWGTCNGGGSNCVTFSAFFISKFTTIGAPSDGLWGDGQELVSYLKNRSSVEATFGTDPKVYAIVSTPVQHTAVVLGHHDGKWIVGHASCKNSGVGKGNGGNGNINSEADRGDGSGFIAIEESDDPSQWQWVESGYSFAYPNSVDTKAISEYLTNGT